MAEPSSQNIGTPVKLCGKKTTKAYGGIRKRVRSSSAATKDTEGQWACVLHTRTDSLAAHWDDVVGCPPAAQWETTQEQTSTLHPLALVDVWWRNCSPPWAHAGASFPEGLRTVERKLTLEQWINVRRKEKKRIMEGLPQPPASE